MWVRPVWVWREGRGSSCLPGLGPGSGRSSRMMGAPMAEAWAGHPTAWPHGEQAARQAAGPPCAADPPTAPIARASRREREHARVGLLPRRTTFPGCWLQRLPCGKKQRLLLAVPGSWRPPVAWEAQLLRPCSVTPSSTWVTPGYVAWAAWCGPGTTRTSRHGAELSEFCSACLFFELGRVEIFIQKCS